MNFFILGCVIYYNYTDPPSPPDTVSVQSATYNSASATIQWTEPSDNGGSAIIGYNISISPSTSTCSSCVVSSDTLMYNITELNHTTNYTISVAAINCAGTGDSTVHNISKLTLDILHFKCIQLYRQ